MTNKINPLAFATGTINAIKHLQQDTTNADAASKMATFIQQAQRTKGDGSDDATRAYDIGAAGFLGQFDAYVKANPKISASAVAAVRNDITLLNNDITSHNGNFNKDLDKLSDDVAAAGLDLRPFTPDASSAKGGPSNDDFKSKKGGDAPKSDKPKSDKSDKPKSDKADEPKSKSKSKEKDDSQRFSLTNDAPNKSDATFTQKELDTDAKKKDYNDLADKLETWGSNAKSHNWASEDSPKKMRDLVAALRSGDKDRIQAAELEFTKDAVHGGWDKNKDMNASYDAIISTINRALGTNEYDKRGQ